jgi:hypothetical protein
LTRGVSERWVARRVALSRASHGMPDDQEKQWGGEDLNLRPTDCEFIRSNSATRRDARTELLTRDSPARLGAAIRNTSRSLSGHMRDTSFCGVLPKKRLRHMPPTTEASEGHHAVRHYRRKGDFVKGAGCHHPATDQIAI